MTLLRVDIENNYHRSLKLFTCYREVTARPPVRSDQRPLKWVPMVRSPDFTLVGILASLETQLTSSPDARVSVSVGIR